MGLPIRLVAPKDITAAQSAAGSTLTAVPQRIAPVRFARSGSGFASRTAPDLDDHGFVPCPGGTARGPTVAVVRGPLKGSIADPGFNVTVAVIRDRISTAAALFPVVSDPSLVELVQPAAGSALSAAPSTGAADTVTFRSAPTFDLADHECKLELHFGSVTGPLVAEMSIRVFTEISIRVQIHRVTVDGVTPTTTDSQLSDVFEFADAIWAPAGVQFHILRKSNGTPDVKAETASGAGEGRVWTQDFHVNMPAIMSQDYQRGKLNAYLVPAFSQASIAAIGVARGSFSFLKAGIIFRDLPEVPVGDRTRAMACTVAHEFGHTLKLSHYADAQGPFREDLWAHRALMWNELHIPATAGVSGDVGYGTFTIGGASVRRTGAHITGKNRAKITQSNEIDVARTNANAKTFTE